MGARRRFRASVEESSGGESQLSLTTRAMTPLILTVMACRPEAPPGFYEHCGTLGDSGQECPSHLTCIVSQDVGWCTIPCKEDADCPLTGSGRLTRCIDDWCIEDEPSE